MAHWVAVSGDALPVMVPSPLGDTSRGTSRASTTTRRWLDGLVLMGGSDMWPGHYGEEPLKPATGTATACATNTRRHWRVPSSRAASRCSASAAACRCSTWRSAARCCKTSSMLQAAVAGAPQRRVVRQALPRDRARSRHAAGAAIPRRTAFHGQQRAPPGHQTLARDFIVEARVPRRSR